MTVLPINLSSLVGKISDLSEIRVTVRELELISRDNPDARIETNSQGQVIFTPPTGGETGDRNLELACNSMIFFFIVQRSLRAER